VLKTTKEVDTNAYFDRTLSGMFPDLDEDIISDVVRMKGGK